MSLSACDIGNPIYDAPGPKPASGKNQVNVQIWFNAGQRDEFRTIEFEWVEHPDGFIVVAGLPDFTEYILGPDDPKIDIQYAIEEELGGRVLEIQWVNCHGT